MAISRMSLSVKFISTISAVILVILIAIATILLSRANQGLESQSAGYTKLLVEEKQRAGESLGTHLRDKGDQLADSLAGTLGNALWDVDYDGVERISAAAEKDADVLEVAVWDEKGKPITPAKELSPEAITLERPILYEGKTLGKVRLSLSRAGILKEMQELEGRIASQQELVTQERKALGRKIITDAVLVSVAGVLALCGAIFWLFSRLVLQPLRRTLALAEAVCQGNLGARVDELSGDEMGGLGQALNRMAGSLAEKAALAERIAEGDLTAEIALASENDQFGRSLRKMTANLDSIISQIHSSAGQIAMGGSQVADASQSLSQGATEQASSLEQIGASMHRMASQTRINAENAVLANRLSSQAQSSAVKGNAQMQQMVKAMNEIRASGQNVSRIIKTIDEIAFQTNLLALNAAVEAARAGAHGKGFAVVAEEVRNLAARSARAARETAELIEGSVGRTENGAQIADATAGVLVEIVNSVTKVSDLLGEISASSKEQALGITQVSQGLGQIDQVTQQNTSGAEESAAAAEELSSQASQLKGMLARFRLRAEASSLGERP